MRRATPIPLNYAAPAPRLPTNWPCLNLSLIAVISLVFTLTTNFPGPFGEAQFILLSAAPLILLLRTALAFLFHHRNRTWLLYLPLVPLSYLSLLLHS